MTPGDGLLSRLREALRFDEERGHSVADEALCRFILESLHAYKNGWGETEADKIREAVAIFRGLPKWYA